MNSHPYTDFNKRCFTSKIDRCACHYLATNSSSCIFQQEKLQVMLSIALIHFSSSDKMRQQISLPSHNKNRRQTYSISNTSTNQTPFSKTNKLSHRNIWTDPYRPHLALAMSKDKKNVFAPEFRPVHS